MCKHPNTFLTTPVCVWGGGGGVGSGVVQPVGGPALSAVGARSSSVVKAFAHGAMGRPIDPS